MRLTRLLLLGLSLTAGLLAQSMTSISPDDLPPPLNPTWTPSWEPTLQPWPTNTGAPPQVSQGSTEPEEPVTAQGYLSLEVHKSCNRTQKRMLVDAWDGALLLDHAQQKYVPGGAFSAAMQAYFGANFEYTGPWFTNYKARIGGNLERRHKLDTDQAPASTYVYLYCEDYQFKCVQYPDGLGYSDTYRRGFWTNHYIVMCDNFYRKDSLAQRLELIESYNEPGRYPVIENFQTTRDEIMYHEQMHMLETVCNPAIKDYTYGGLHTWNLAKNKGCSWSTVNADSYTYAALAIYIQDRYQLEGPPRPWKIWNPLSTQDYPPYLSAFDITEPIPPYLGGDDGAFNSTVPPGLTYSTYPDDPPIMDLDTWTPFSVISEENDLPSTSSSSTSLNSTSSKSFSSTPSSSTSRVDHVTTSTTAVPIVTPPPPFPTRAFEIMFKQGTVDQIQLDAWTVYQHPVGEATKINACDGGFSYLSAGDAVSFPTSLGPFADAPFSGCKYQGPATAPGSVSCPDLPTWSACTTAPASTQVCDNGAGYDQFYAQVECEF